MVLLLLPQALADDKTKIVGGVEVNPEGRYPFQVAMIDSNGNQYCGGSLVDKDWVLCAAHCAGVGSRVYIGRHDLSDDNEIFDSIEIDWETMHPDYKNETMDNDFMMVKLKQSSSKTPVTLDDDSVDLSAGVDVTVMGWGTTSSQGAASDILMEVEVDIVSNSECNNDYSGRITDNMVCASRSGKDSCQGDSGGPLIMKGGDVSSDVQVGVVSFGKGCADPSFPGVYARVSSKISWIKEQIASGTRPDNNNGGGCMRSFFKQFLR